MFGIGVRPPHRRPKPADNIWHKFCFLDESGSLNDPQSPFFTVGLLKITDPSYLMREIRKERDRSRFYDEMHFNKSSARNLPFAKKAIDLLFKMKSVNFSSYTVDKAGPFFAKTFAKDPWRAYEGISMRLLEASAASNEVLIVLADHVTTPPYIHFEGTVKSVMNKKARETIVAGVTRIDSKSNDILQLVDLLIGCINYDLKLETRVAKTASPSKSTLAQHFKTNLGATSFIDGFRSFHFSIFVDKDIKQRTPVEGVPA